jgi:hypothetical protein
VSEPDIEIVDETSEPDDASNPPLWEAWDKSDQSAQREFVEVHWGELKPFIKAELKGDLEVLEYQNEILREEVADLRRQLKEIEESEIGELKLENDNLRRKLEAAKPPGRCGWVKDDGGRRANGYGRSVSDCVARAITIATRKPYPEVFEALKAGAAEHVKRWPHSKTAGWIKKSRSGGDPANGCYDAVSARYLRSIGWQYTRIRERTFLRADQLPPGRLVVKINRHAVAVIDGVIHDTFDSGGSGRRPVEGYWSKATQVDDRHAADHLHHNHDGDKQ